MVETGFRLTRARSHSTTSSILTTDDEVTNSASPPPRYRVVMARQQTKAKACGGRDASLSRKALQVPLFFGWGGSSGPRSWSPSFRGVGFTGRPSSSGLCTQIIDGRYRRFRLRSPPISCSALRWSHICPRAHRRLGIARLTLAGSRVLGAGCRIALADVQTAVADVPRRIGQRRRMGGDQWGGNKRYGGALV